MGNNKNDLFNFFFDDFFAVKTHRVKTTKEAVVLSVIAPGHKKEDFKVEVSEGKVHVFMPQNTKRVFKIPTTVSTHDITAEYTAGILNIKFLRKNEEKITIKVN